MFTTGLIQSLFVYHLLSLPSLNMNMKITESIPKHGPTATIFDNSISIEDDTNTIEFPIQITFSPSHYIYIQASIFRTVFSPPIIMIQFRLSLIEFRVPIRLITTHNIK
ncbi:hypothetical protein HanIR_Chr12g0573211 [Helianthus annuus]|nr:hypothetical protein HanIR_Chr12g0573211 [Helianthus annuus]